jgi:hypothetical protein
MSKTKSTSKSTLRRKKGDLSEGKKLYLVLKQKRVIIAPKVQLLATETTPLARLLKTVSVLYKSWSLEPEEMLPASASASL